MDGRGKQKPLETHRIKTVGESNIIDKPGTSPNDRTPTPQSRDCYCIHSTDNLGLCSDGCTNAGEGCADDTWCFGQGEVSEVDILQRMYVGVPEFEMADTGYLERTGNYILWWSGKGPGDQIWPFYENGVCKNDTICYYLQNKWQNGYITTEEFNFYKYEDANTKWGRWYGDQSLWDLHQRIDNLPWAPPHPSFISRDHERAVLSIEFGSEDQLQPTNGTNPHHGLFNMLYRNISAEQVLNEFPWYNDNAIPQILDSFPGIQYTDFSHIALDTYYAQGQSFMMWYNPDSIPIFNDPTIEREDWWTNMSTNPIHSTLNGDTQDDYPGNYHHLSLYAHQGTTFGNCGPESYSCVTYGQSGPPWDGFCNECPSWYTWVDIPGWEAGWPLSHPGTFARLEYLELQIAGTYGYNTLPQNRAIVNFKFGQNAYNDIWDSTSPPPGRQNQKKGSMTQPNIPFRRGGGISEGHVIGDRSKKGSRSRRGGRDTSSCTCHCDCQNEWQDWEWWEYVSPGGMDGLTEPGGGCVAVIDYSDCPLNEATGVGTEITWGCGGDAGSLNPDFQSGETTCDCDCYENMITPPPSREFTGKMFKNVRGNNRIRPINQSVGSDNRDPNCPPCCYTYPTQGSYQCCCDGQDYSIASNCGNGASVRHSDKVACMNYCFENQSQGCHNAGACHCDLTLGQCHNNNCIDLDPPPPGPYVHVCPDDTWVWCPHGADCSVNCGMNTQGSAGPSRDFKRGGSFNRNRMRRR